MVNNLQQMAQRRESWLNEKPQGNNNLLRGLMNGDEVFFWFAGNGDEGDRLIKIFRSHALPTVVNGKAQSVNRYCLMQNDNLECPYCAQGHTNMKERMGIWMYITNILHATIDPKWGQDRLQNMVATTFEGRMMYNETINDFRLWDTSAWRDSPWGDIIKLADMYQGLHNFMAQMTVSGVQLTRRFKIYARPNTNKLDPMLYQRAMQELEPIPDYFKKQLATPVIVNPQAEQQQVQQQAANNVINWQPGGMPSPVVAPFAPPGSTVATQTFVPGGAPEQAQPQPAPQVAPQQPAAFDPSALGTNSVQAPPVAQEPPQTPQPATAAVEPQPTVAAPPVAAPVQEQPQATVATNETPPWENVDANKPLAKMF